MRPLPIPPEMVPAGGEARIIKGNPEKNIEDVQALLMATPEGDVVFGMLIEVDEMDMVKLQRDQRFWLYQVGTPLHPFALEPAYVSEEVEPTGVSRELQAVGRQLAEAWKQHAGEAPASVVVSTLASLKTSVSRAVELLLTHDAPASMGLKNLRIVGDAEVDGVKVGEVAVPMEHPTSDHCAAALPEGSDELPRGDRAHDPATT